MRNTELFSEVLEEEGMLQRRGPRRDATPPAQGPPRGVRRESDESGLTTLEWLLIVAAIAALAALAVVLVQQVVEDTSDQVGGQNVRQLAAKVAAGELFDRARDADPTDPRFATWSEWERYFTEKCNLLKITYGDAVSKINALFMRPDNTDADDKPTRALLAATSRDDGPEPLAHCEVDY